MKRAVIFDLDGTLLNTLEDLANSVNLALAEFGFPTHDVEEYKYFVGDGAKTLIRRALPPGSREDALDKTLSAFTKRYSLHSADRTRPYPGVPEMLKGLSLTGTSMAVLSNKPHIATLAVLAEYFEGVCFKAALGARDGVPLKPDPAGALEIAALFGISPDGFLYLGDTGVDMRTALAAGMTPVGALWGFRTRQELLESGARHIIERPGELAELLGSL